MELLMVGVAVLFCSLQAVGGSSVLRPARHQPAAAAEAPVDECSGQEREALCRAMPRSRALLGMQVLQDVPPLPHELCSVVANTSRVVYVGVGGWVVQ